MYIFKFKIIVLIFILLFLYLGSLYLLFFLVFMEYDFEFSKVVNGKNIVNIIF